MSSDRALVLSFAASDPTGGAGLQADLLTLSAMGCHPLSVMTGYTAQDTEGVRWMVAIEAERVTSQAETLFADLPVDAIKIGVTGSAANCAAIAEILAAHPSVPVVLDPVFASGRGDPLGEEAVIGATRRLLLPRASVVTPNIHEARQLADAGDEVPLEECAARLTDWGCPRVLVTGAHEDGPDVVNRLYGVDGLIREERWERLEGSYHGSGCTLSAAIAAALANGLDASNAISEAQEYTWRALEAGFRPGRGQAIADRLFWARSMQSPGGR